MTTTINASASAGLITTADTSTILQLQTNGTAALTVDTSQNIGIGTASPSYKLDILTGGGGVYAAQFGNGTAAQGMRIVTGMDSTSSGITTAGGTRLIQFDGTNNITQFYTNASERMRIDSSGRVLINKTSTDGGQLNVQNGSTTTRAYVNATLRNSRPAGNNYCVTSWNGNYIADAWIGQTPSSDALCFGHDAGTTIAESMRLDTNGNLYIGTTNSSATAGVGMKFIFSADSANPVVKTVVQDSSGAYSTWNLYSTNAGAYRFYVTTAGAINATSTSITAISDRTLKTNIRDLETGLTEVMALKPRRFDWLNGDAQNIAGFVAQEVEPILPDLVTDYVYSTDEDGNDVVKKALKMGDILPTLVKAIQEQQALITQLQADVAALKGA